jgi:NADH-quinone oxidoreductase subunit E
MSSVAKHKPEELLSPEMRAEIDRWIAKYPPDRKQAAVMAALRIVQEKNGWLTPELVEAVAVYLEMPPVAAMEVATFYSMYDLKPVGRHKICVCTNISCLLRGSDEAMAHLKKKLGVQAGETTPDGKFTLQEVECLGACTGAPAMQVGKKYYENLTPQKLDEILKELE